MVRYYYVLDQETYHAIRCTVEPKFCNACQTIVEAESCVTAGDFERHIASCRRVGVSETWLAELALLREFLTGRVSGRKCLTCGSEDLVAIQADLDMLISGIKSYAFLDKEGNGVAIEAKELQQFRGLGPLRACAAETGTFRPRRSFPSPRHAGARDQKLRSLDGGDGGGVVGLGGDFADDLRVGDGVVLIHNIDRAGVEAQLF
jgi:hypothetical protein